MECKMCLYIHCAVSAVPAEGHALCFQVHSHSEFMKWTFSLVSLNGSQVWYKKAWFDFLECRCRSVARSPGLKPATDWSTLGLTLRSCVRNFGVLTTCRTQRANSIDCDGTRLKPLQSGFHRTLALATHRQKAKKTNTFEWRPNTRERLLLPS